MNQTVEGSCRPKTGSSERALFRLPELKTCACAEIERDMFTLKPSPSQTPINGGSHCLCAAGSGRSCKQTSDTKRVCRAPSDLRCFERSFLDAPSTKPTDLRQFGCCIGMWLWARRTPWLTTKNEHHRQPTRVWGSRFDPPCFGCQAPGFLFQESVQVTQHF